MEPQEYSESGAPVYKYEIETKKAFTPAHGDIETIEAVSKHIETHIGKIECVFHEIVSDMVHIDVYWVKPTEKYPFHSLITSGMSDLPMHVPEDYKNYEKARYAELCILLPPEWPIEGNSYALMSDVFKEQKYYWPVYVLKTIAKMPHEYNSWVGWGHTVASGPDTEPYAENTSLCCMMLYPSLSLGKSFFELKINSTKTVRFYCLYPLYKEEMEFKMKYGCDELTKKFEKYAIDDVVRIRRKNTCAKKGFLGLW